MLRGFLCSIILTFKEGSQLLKIIIISNKLMIKISHEYFNWTLYKTLTIKTLS